MLSILAEEAGATLNKWILRRFSCQLHCGEDDGQLSDFPCADRILKEELWCRVPEGIRRLGSHHPQRQRS